MVRAILDGQKTMTRRPLKPLYFDYIEDWDNNDKNYGPCFEDEYGGWHNTAIKCPYGQPGDRLWVKETWAAVDLATGYALEKQPKENKNLEIVYKASTSEFVIGSLGLHGLLFKS